MSRRCRAGRIGPIPFGPGPAETVVSVLAAWQSPERAGRPDKLCQFARDVGRLGSGSFSLTLSLTDLSDLSGKEGGSRGPRLGFLTGRIRQVRRGNRPVRPGAWSSNSARARHATPVGDDRPNAREEARG